MYPTVKREQRLKLRIIRGKAVVSQSCLAHLVGIRAEHHPIYGIRPYRNGVNTGTGYL